MIKRILATMLISIMLLSLIACKKSKNVQSQSAKETNKSIESSEPNFSNGDDEFYEQEDLSKENGSIVKSEGKNNNSNSQKSNSKNSSTTSKSNNSSSQSIISNNVNKNDVMVLNNTGSGNSVAIPTKGFKTDIPKTSFSESYLIPPKSITDIPFRGLTTYENSYVKVDLSTSTKGYFLLTYKESYAKDIQVTFDIQNAVSMVFENSIHYHYGEKDFSNNKAIAVKWPKEEAIYYISIWSTINGTKSCKMCIDVGRITLDGAISVDDMLPSEDKIKLTQTSSGVYSNKYVNINTNTISKGYIDLDYIEPNALEIKLAVYSNVPNQYDGEGSWHCHVSPKGKYNIKIPLTYGNTTYSILVYSHMVNAEGHYIYSKKAEIDIKVTNAPATAPFLLSTGEVIFNNNMQVIKKASQIASTCKNDFEKVSKIYDWLTDYISYKETEETALMFYKCDIEKIYNRKTGVCYDFAVVLAAMLRSQGIPCKVVFGKYSATTESVGHVWNEVYVPSSGSIKTNKLSITGNKWCILDPTYTNVNASETSINFMNDRSNYKWQAIY